MSKRRRMEGQRRSVRFRRRSTLTPTPSEMKFHDLDLTDVVVAAGGEVFANILTIPEGNGEEQRVGRKIVIRSIGWRYNVSLPEQVDATQTTDIVRIMLVLDKQCNGAAPAVADVLRTGAGLTFQSFNNLSNGMRFTVLHDRVIPINTNAGSGRGGTDTLAFGRKNFNFAFYKKCNIRVEYDNSAATGVITSIRSNNLFVLFISKVGLAGVQSKFRLRFND